MAFPHKIFPYEVKGAWTVDVTLEKTSIPENFPLSLASWNQDTIDLFSHNEKRTIGEEFIPNPNYISPSSIENIWYAARSLGYFVTGVGVFLDGRSLYHEFHKSMESGNYANTYRESARIGSGWLAAGKMGLFYAEVGVTDCAAFTPYVQATCGVAMGLFGSVAGYYGASTIGVKLYDVSTSHPSSAPQYDNRAWPLSSRTAITFFKPSEWLPHQEDAPAKEPLPKNHDIQSPLRDDKRINTLEENFFSFFSTKATMKTSSTPRSILVDPGDTPSSNFTKTDF